MALIVTKAFGDAYIRRFFCLVIGVTINADMLAFIISYTSGWDDKDEKITK